MSFPPRLPAILAAAALVAVTAGASLAQQKPPATGEAAGASGAAAAQQADPAALEQGRTFTRQFYSGELVNLQDTFSADMKAAFDLTKLADQRQQMIDLLGEEVEVVDEAVRSQGIYTMYLRRARYAKKDEPFDLQWGWNQDGEIVGFKLGPGER